MNAVNAESFPLTSSSVSFSSAKEKECAALQECSTLKNNYNEQADSLSFVYHTAMNRTVTLTDETGTPLGEVDIIDAHTGSGKLHKAFSVYVFNPEKTAVLIQKRAESKMLFAGIWANTCCSHPFSDEAPQAAGERRLQEELGFSVPLTVGPSFVYRAEDPNGEYTEHEYDILLLGMSDSAVHVTPDPKEVADWKWIHIEELQTDMQKNPALYAPWFHLGLPKALSALHHD